jgi:hypothetical protein
MQGELFECTSSTKKHTGNDLKICCECEQGKPLSEYYVLTTRVHKIKTEPTVQYHNKCKSCFAVNNNITTKLKETAPPTSGFCDCCNKPLADKYCLDHDHNTLEFRGWLCYSCNTGLGKLGDDIEGLEKGLAYLRNHYER